MSLQKVRDSLVHCLADKVIDYEEFVLLYNPYKSKNAAYLYWEYEEFCLDSLSSEAEAFAIHSGSHCHFDTSLGCPAIKFENACKNKWVRAHTSHLEENPRLSPPGTRAPKLWIKRISSRPFLSCSGRPALITATYLSSSWWSIPAKWAGPLSS